MYKDRYLYLILIDYVTDKMNLKLSTNIMTRENGITLVNGANHVPAIISII